MKLVLILMIKNESRILKRCLEALENVVDAYCIHDTGSTDNSLDIAKEFIETRKGCVTQSEWKNFGHNRTLSFRAARDYVRDALTWSLEDTYGLLLDADMVFVPNKLRNQTLTERGYTILQCAGHLEYPNCRLVRMDFDWSCVGVTHEYWSGPTKPLSKDICWIDDRNDGGCKSDKFERDARLLEKGLEEEPDNVRYMFYLAQTYHSLGRYNDAIAMYKKRIAAGGWEEEVWYSHYMIGKSYHALEDYIEFEAWMLRAYKRRPTRAEPIHKLTKHFREKGEQFKAYHYARIGKKISRPSDSLFIEKDVYDRLFDYEITILMYYVSSNKVDGLRKTIDYLLRTNDSGVFANMVFYVTPIGKGTPLTLNNRLFGDDYHPSSVSTWKQDGMVHMNVRYVNYRISSDKPGVYEMCEKGVYNTTNVVRTQNAYLSLDRNVAMNDSTIALSRLDKRVRGLEDIRVFKRNNQLWFTATTQEFSQDVRVLYGRYDPLGHYSECKILESPHGLRCEKNWLGIPHTDDMIYGWYPFQVGKVEDTRLRIHTTHKTPVFFERMRGSAVPLLLDDEYWVMTHIVEYTTPRRYYHVFVVLDMKTYAPKRVTLPFVFENIGIEYCIGTHLGESGIECIYSSKDANPAVTTIPFNRLEWILL
jgi:glycosyltransferase involved in cell wall biosynthesis